MTFQKIEPKKKSQLATEALLDVIKTRQFKPGDKLPPERIMAAEMGVSRNTLREAIAALQILGVLEVRHSQGNFVVNPNQTDNLSSTLEAIFDSNDDPFMTIDARIAFEPGVASLAAHLASTADFKAVEKERLRVIDAIKSNDLEEYAQGDYCFHLRIAECTHNPIIIQTVQCMTKSLTQPLWRSMKKSLAVDETIINARMIEHDGIFQALINRDPHEARERVYMHLVHSKERLMLEIENGDKPY